MASALAWAAQVAIVLLLAGALTYVLRRPRLHVELSLRGGTRAGKLYVTITNRGGIAAGGSKVAVAWIGEGGARALVEEKALGTIEARDAIRLEVTGLHRGIGSRPEGWEAIEVSVRARMASAARATLAVSPRVREGETDATPVRYAPRDAPCPGAPDGAHRYEERRIVNDGVTEVWRMCGRCRHVVRDPLSEADKAAQARVRRERAERERKKVEAEFARNARDDHEPPRPRGRPTWKAPRDEPARDEDRLPPDVAFYILDLDPARATWHDVAAAHRRLALANHPDRRYDLPPDARAAAERKMQEINAARDRLREHFGLRAPLE